MALARAVTDAGAILVDADVAETCRIENGRPAFGKDMTEDTIPLEAGIEDRAISLTKGCYVGQEIIIRVLHRGQGRVARRLVGLTFDPTAAAPARGSAIRGGDREIGAVTSAVWSPALGRPIAMGYVHRDFVEPGTAVVVVTGGPIGASERDAVAICCRVACELSRRSHEARDSCEDRERRPTSRSFVVFVSFVGLRE